MEPCKIWIEQREATRAIGADEAVLKKDKTAKKTLTPAEPWFVYILRCGDGSLYTGITKNVTRRLEQHNAGTAARYTRCRLPVSLEHEETHASQSLALKREAEIKAMSRLEKESLIRPSA